MTWTFARCALAGALLWGCAEKKEAAQPRGPAGPLGAPAPAPAAARATPRAAAPPGPALPKSVPTAAEADLALILGKALLEEAKPDEAEVQLKVAAAGGRAEADELLLKVRGELAAKRLISEARQKLEARDWRGAEAALAGIGADSSLRARADEMFARIAAAKGEEAERMKRRLEKELDKEGEPSAPESDESKARPE
jgi:hypothetical protein